MILFLLVYYIYLIYRSMEAMHMLQQNLYNENNRYLRWINKNTSRAFSIYDIIPVFFICFAYFVKEKNIIDFTLVASSMVYMYCIYLEYKQNKDNQNKIPLKVTSRIKRLFITLMIMYLMVTIPLLSIKNYALSIFVLIIAIVMISLIYFITYLAMIINMPIDKLEMFIYLKKAKNKLMQYNNLQIIGITGSYGKTSSKNILYEMLSSKYIVRKSPMNYNTVKGLMITVNNYLDKFDEVLIAEMGAYVSGDIYKCCKLLKPKYGILTVIGDAHLETFKSKENIQKTKFELIENLSSDGLAILNRDDPYQVNYHLKNKVKVMWIGIDNKDADLYATNIKFSDKGMSFDCVYENSTENFNTKLLGKHNIYNILAGILLSIKMGISLSEIKASVSGLKPIEHRLELKKIGDFYQLDDAYNSNPVGAKSALDVLSLMDGDKCVVTPGMIELGSIEKKENFKFGQEISKVADYVILIGKKRTEDIYNGLLDNKFDKDKVFILNSVVDAYRLINSLIDSKKKMYALFENDLPDIYTEGE